MIVTVTDDGQPNESAKHLFVWNVSALNNAPTITVDFRAVQHSGDTVSLQV